MVFRVGDGVLCVGRCNEIGGNDLGTLMDELVEGVLAVCARRAPDDWL